ncbi:hypothetical protein J6590_085053 [Homalodisca vitripennis]|nr:hypothetical protein J6590_085053 [Homalodisca vitripennis]
MFTLMETSKAVGQEVSICTWPYNLMPVADFAPKPRVWEKNCSLCSTIDINHELPNYSYLFIISDDAYFILSCDVNKHNMRHWRAHNSSELQPKPL